jgi:putative transposase
MSVANKKAGIEESHPALSVSRQGELIALPRSSYYRTDSHPYKESNASPQLMGLIEEEYTRHPFYGTRKMRDYLRRKGFKVNRKRVQRLIRIMGIQSVAPKPYTSIPRKEHKPESVRHSGFPLKN